VLLFYNIDDLFEPILNNSIDALYYLDRIQLADEQFPIFNRLQLGFFFLPILRDRLLEAHNAVPEIKRDFFLRSRQVAALLVVFIHFFDDFVQNICQGVDSCDRSLHLFDDTFAV
jgi:hypothetical protein